METIDVKDIENLIEFLEREAEALVPFINKLGLLIAEIDALGGNYETPYRQRAELMERSSTLYNIIRKLQLMVKTK